MCEYYNGVGIHFDVVTSLVLAVDLFVKQFNYLWLVNL